MGRSVLFGFILLLVLVPLPLGANRPIPWTVLALVVALLLLLWGAAAARRSDPQAAVPERLWPAVVAFALVGFWVLVQMAPITPRAWHHPLWVEAAGVLGTSLPGRISVDPGASATALMRLLTYAGVFWLAVQLGRAPGGARRIVAAIAFAGLAYALWGLFSYFFEPEKILWWRKWYEMRGLTSSFVNRNHYATYAGLGLLAATGLSISTVYHDLLMGPARRRPWRWRLARVTWHGWWLVLAVPLLATALVLTRSRAGTTSTALAMAVLIVSFGATRLMRLRHVVISALLVAGLGVSAYTLAGDDLGARLAVTDMGQNDRLPVYGRVLDAIQDAPLLGTGYGSFAQVFRGYQAGVTDFFYDHAHDTYLENALELGIPATALLLAAIGLVVVSCVQGLRRRRRNALHPCLGLAATALVGLHALLDFSLELPAVAVTYAAILGVAWARSRRPGRRSGPGWWRHPATGPALAASVALCLLVLAGPRLAARLQALPIVNTTRQLESGAMPGPGALERAIAAGKRAAAFADAADLWRQVGIAELALAGQPLMLPNARQSRLERAEDALRRSLADAPANPTAWAQLAYVALRLGRPGPLVDDGLALSVRIAPIHPPLMAFRAAVALAAWGRLDSSTRAAFERQFGHSMRLRPQQFVEAIRKSDRVEVVATGLEYDPVLQARFEHILFLLGRD